MTSARCRKIAATLLLVAIAGFGWSCSDSESASEQVCDARDDVDDAIQQVSSDVRSANFGDAREGLEDVESSVQELVDAVDQLGAQERQQLRADVDQLEENLDSMGEVTSLADLEDKFEVVRSEASSALQNVDNELQCE